MHKKTARFPRRAVFLSYIIRIRLAQNDYQVYQGAKPQKSERQQPDNSGAYLAFVKTVDSEFAEEQAQEKC